MRRIAGGATAGRLNTGISERLSDAISRNRAVIGACAVRTLFSFLLTRGELFGGIYPFGIAFLSASPVGAKLIASLAGALLGAVTLGTLLKAAVYTSALILAAGLLTTLDRGKYGSDPALASCTALTSSLLVAVLRCVIGGLTLQTAAAGLSEILLAFFCAEAFRRAMTVRVRPGEGMRSSLQALSTVMLAAALLTAAVPLRIFHRVSIGRTAAIAAAQIIALCGGAGAGAACGAILGIVMDLAGSTLGIYGAACGFASSMCGCFHSRGKLPALLAYCLSSAAAVLWAASQGAPDILYETFIASVLVLLLPGAVTARLAEYLPPTAQQSGITRARRSLRDRVRLAQRAFGRLSDGIADTRTQETNDGDVAGIFQRAALGVCRRCPGAKQCWQTGFAETLHMLNDASPPMLERGELTVSDLPEPFMEQCCRPGDYTAAVNAELKAWLCRKQYRARFNENLGSVCRRYNDMAQVLDSIALQLDEDPSPQTGLERRVRSYMRTQHLAVSPLVYLDSGGRLRAELSGSGVVALRRDAGWLDKLSALLETKLRTGADTEDGRIVLLQAEELTASVGTASARRRGGQCSGDGSTAFTTDDGKLCVILSDGMGTGSEAGEMSRSSIEALTDFVMAGVPPHTAIGLLESMMLFKNESDVVSATVDMLVVDLLTGQGELYKCGSAPTYILRGEGVRCIRAGGFAPGFGPEGTENTQVTKLRLQSGDMAVIISDGVLAGEDDTWLRKMLADNTEPPRALAKKLAESSAARFGASDDVTVLAVAVK